jgi:hypothetical protein
MLALVGYSIAFTPALITIFMSDPFKFPRFQKLVFGGPTYDKTCLFLVTSYLANHIPGNHPPYSKRLELTHNLLLVESFRSHNFFQYFVVPIWIFAVNCPWLGESVKTRAIECLTGMTTTLKAVWLGGMATFAVMDQHIHVINGVGTRLVPYGGYLAMIIGVVRALCFPSCVDSYTI